ncbi:MAG: hypothetical protein ABJ059_16505, partial [Hyphomicrobiales bacterium]
FASTMPSAVYTSESPSVFETCRGSMQTRRSRVYGQFWSTSTAVHGQGNRQGSGMNYVFARILTELEPK